MRRTEVSKRWAEPTPEDVRWTEDRVIALMNAGMAFVDAAQVAALECTQRVLDRDIKHIAAVEQDRQRRREQQRERADVAHAEQRAHLEAKATLGQRPTLKATLGDLLTAKRAPKP